MIVIWCPIESSDTTWLRLTHDYAMHPHVITCNCWHQQLCSSGFSCKVMKRKESKVDWNLNFSSSLTFIHYIIITINHKLRTVATDLTWIKWHLHQGLVHRWREKRGAGPGVTDLQTTFSPPAPNPLLSLIKFYCANWLREVTTYKVHTPLMSGFSWGAKRKGTG